MDIEREIKDRRPGGQYPELTARGEHEYLPGRRLRQILGTTVTRMLKGVSDGSQPLVHLLLMEDSFIGPMGSLAVLGLLVHPTGADLDLQIRPATILHSNMQRLVTIGFRIGYPITETVGVLLILLGNIGEHFPAKVLLYLRIRLTVYNEADSEHIENSFKRNLLLPHLCPDRVSGLCPYLQFVLDPLV